MADQLIAPVIPASGNRRPPGGSSHGNILVVDAIAVAPGGWLPESGNAAAGASWVGGLVDAVDLG